MTPNHSGYLDPRCNHPRPCQLQQARDTQPSRGSGDFQKQESLLQSEVQTQNIISLQRNSIEDNVVGPLVCLSFEEILSINSKNLQLTAIDFKDLLTID